MNLKIRDIQPSDSEKLIDYFLNASPTFLKNMGADQSKLPKREKWLKKLKHEAHKEDKQKKSFYVIWLLDDEPIGHSNINDIEFGVSGEMHLHMWKVDKRRSGLGFKFLQLSIREYFKRFKLKTIICEPNSENKAPNKTLTKLGFKFIKRYETKPSAIALFQTVNHYELDRNDFQGID
ncbi:MAG: GNAT family protein [Bacteroidota bacterium]